MNWLKDKLLAALVGRFGPLVSTSISGAVAGLVGGGVALIQAKVPSVFWEWIVIGFHSLPDELEAQLTPAKIGLAAGTVFYGCLQEWLNQRQSKGIKAVQKAANAALPESEKVKVDGVATKEGETVQAVKATVRRAIPVHIGGLRGQRGHIIFSAIAAMAVFCLIMMVACAARQSKAAAWQKAKAQHANEVTRSSRSTNSPTPVAIFYDVTYTPDLPRNIGGQWFQASNEARTTEYNRPAWQRLLTSIHPWGESGSSHGRATIDPSGVTVSGGWKDGEEFSYSKMMPSSFAAGIGGGMQFHDFTHP